MHYCGGQEPHCQCVGCTETHIEFLTIDHVKGDGAAHRKETGLRTGSDTYAWLRRNNFPAGFRVLCFNCNASEGFHGYCPHNTTPPPEPPPRKPGRPPKNDPSGTLKVNASLVAVVD